MTTELASHLENSELAIVGLLSRVNRTVPSISLYGTCWWEEKYDPHAIIL